MDREAVRTRGNRDRNGLTVAPRFQTRLFSDALKAARDDDDGRPR